MAAEDGGYRRKYHWVDENVKVYEVDHFPGSGMLPMKILKKAYFHGKNENMEVTNLPSIVHAVIQ